MTKMKPEIKKYIISKGGIIEETGVDSHVVADAYLSMTNTWWNGIEDRDIREQIIIDEVDETLIPFKEILFTVLKNHIEDSKGMTAREVYSSFIEDWKGAIRNTKTMEGIRNYIMQKVEPK